LTNSQINNEKHKKNIQDLISSVASYLDDPNLTMAAIMAIGEIARNGHLIFANIEAKISLVDKLNRKVLTSKETNKVKEKAVATLGYLCIHDNGDFKYTYEDKLYDSLSKYVMVKLLNSSQAKQIELHMAIGEALVDCALGKSSKSSLNTWLIDSKTKIDKENNVNPNENVDWLLNELFSSYLNSQNQHLRQASCFWLLILTKKCSHLLIRHLDKIQDAFIQRLGENDEMTQDVASKGIGIIFSIADEQTKEILVSRLVESLIGSSKKKVGSTGATSGMKILNENEEIFQSEQIGKTPEGQNITTYKELCSLASDLNR
jgi:proteasome component ECM29